MTEGWFHVIIFLNSNPPDIATVLLIMRVYAMYYRNKWVLCVVVSELTVAICIACVSGCS